MIFFVVFPDSRQFGWRVGGLSFLGSVDIIAKMKRSVREGRTYWTHSDVGLIVNLRHLS